MYLQYVEFLIESIPWYGTIGSFYMWFHHHHQLSDGPIFVHDHICSVQHFGQHVLSQSDLHLTESKQNRQQTTQSMYVCIQFNSIQFHVYHWQINCILFELRCFTAFPIGKRTKEKNKNKAQHQICITNRCCTTVRFENSDINITPKLFWFLQCTESHWCGNTIYIHIYNFN